MNTPLLHGGFSHHLPSLPPTPHTRGGGCSAGAATCVLHHSRGLERAQYITVLCNAFSSSSHTLASNRVVLTPSLYPFPQHPNPRLTERCREMCVEDRRAIVHAKRAKKELEAQQQQAAQQGEGGDGAAAVTAASAPMDV